MLFAWLECRAPTSSPFCLVLFGSVRFGSVWFGFCSVLFCTSSPRPRDCTTPDQAHGLTHSKVRWVVGGALGVVALPTGEAPWAVRRVDYPADG